ncbi:MAG: DUF1851 domain-containing protein [Psychrosphaera sp.]|nr:DUF1851 domain-containing protein [Psychrosphaera sp.]
MNSPSQFERFINHYPIEQSGKSAMVDNTAAVPDIPGYAELAEQYADCSFHHGLYRLFSVGDVEKWTPLVLGIFSQLKDKINCFASNWMGYIYAWDNTEQCVWMLDPGFGEAMKIPCDFYQLHNQEFVDYADDALEKTLFEQCLQSNPGELDNNACYGYIVSPFLDGEDELVNREITDMEVYWSICEDIYAQVQ